VVSIVRCCSSLPPINEDDLDKEEDEDFEVVYMYVFVSQNDESLECNEFNV